MRTDEAMAVEDLHSDLRAEIASMVAIHNSDMDSLKIQADKIESDAKVIAALRGELQRIIDHYDTRTKLYTNDADVAAGMATVARHAIEQTAGENK